MKQVDVSEATHVKVNGQLEPIADKWGVNGRYLAPPSKGGFGVITVTGQRVTMWQADSYWKEE